MFKHIMIPVAAFAVTATSASAFNTALLEEIDLDLTSAEISALEEAHELRVEGDREGAKEVLEDAGLDRDDLKEIRDAVKAERETARAAIKEAIEDEDYDEFMDVAADTKLAEYIEDEDDFELLVEAHELKEAGDREGAKAIMDELGIQKPENKKGGRGGDREGRTQKSN